jgi:hypothetical protein
MDWMLGFSRDGKLLAITHMIAGDEKESYVVRILESASLREIARFPGEQNRSSLFAFAPDGRLLAHGAGLPAKEKEVKPDPGLPNGFIDKLEYLGPMRDSRGVQAIVIRDMASAQSIAKDERKKRNFITGHLGSITCLAFSPDGKFLATGGSDQVVYVWPVEQFFTRSAPPEFKGNVADYWPHLAEADAGKAHRAIAQLELKPKEAIALLRKQIKPAPVAEGKVITQHLRDLSSGNFAVRQQANLALERLGEQAIPHVIEALKKPANLEVKRRLETLRDKLDRPMEFADNLRAYRALVLLERINNAESRKLLEELSRGAPASWLTIEARHALERLR